jgi:hypothetical protein
MSDLHSATFVLAGQKINFPEPAAGTAVKNAARRFESAWGLPAEASFALASILVDPAAARQAVDPRDPFEHLQQIQTPDGKMLLALRATVWTAPISGDGGNGRSRYRIQTANGNGPRTRPWPIGRHHRPAIIDYHPAALDDMAAAVKMSASAIRSPDLITQIARNPRGVWNPPVVVLARVHTARADGTIEERWFPHTIEGSTRVEGCHELCGTDAAAPLMRSDKPLEHLREWHAKLVETFETTPTSAKALAASRAATMPALIVVAAREADGETPIEGGFPTVVNDYVESVHVQPRPFDDTAQNNVIGERFVIKLQQEGRMSHEDAEALLGRSAAVAGKPSIRAAKLVHAVCNPENDSLVRDFVITAENARLTKVKRAKLIGPLVVRQFDRTVSSAEAALMRAFTPDLLVDEPWDIQGDGSESLRQRCLADYDDGKAGTPAIAELMARGGPALCAAGLLLSDQESTVRGLSLLRGHVDKVVAALAESRGGIAVLADAVAWADGDRLERPRVFDIEGTAKVDDNGDQLHFAPEWRKGNMGIRALAFNQGVVPQSNTPPEPDDDAPISPEESFHRKEGHLLELLGRAKTVLMDMYAATDEQQRKLIAVVGLRNAPLYEDLPKALAKAYAKYGKSEDDLFDEDELPVIQATLVDDGDGGEE